MYREAMADLIAWKNSKNRLPLIIRGARQVGKNLVNERIWANAVSQICLYQF